MRVLIASTATQGEQPDDFFHAVEGELVCLANVCAECVADPATGCGCTRSFIGLASGRTTTTAEVAELDMTLREYFALIEESLRRRGYHGDVGNLAGRLLENLMAVILRYPPGTVAGRRMEDVYLRRRP